MFQPKGYPYAEGNLEILTKGLCQSGKGSNGSWEERTLLLVVTTFGALPITKTHWICLIGMGASASELKGLIN